MRIDDSNRLSYLSTNQNVKRNESPEKGSDANPSNAGSVVNAQSANPSSNDGSRAERLDKLKKMMSEGRPIDAGKLANKMLDSGIFFDERA